MVESAGQLGNTTNDLKIIITNSPEINVGVVKKKICKDGRILGQNNSYHKPEYIKKQREAHLGSKSHLWKGGVSKKWKRKYEAQKHYLYSKENLEKLKKIGSRNKNGKNNPMYNKQHSKETKIKMSQKKKHIFLGKGNPNWHGGISFETYSPVFNIQLKEEIRKRDNYKCQECFGHQNELKTIDKKSYKLIVHHIDFNKNNNNSNNLISLCRKCHVKTNYNRKYWAIHFQNKLWRGFIR